MQSERLDFLMKLTDTTNNSLAHAVSFDQSYISKIRKGQRRATRNQDFLNAISAFFARRITEPYQRAAAAEAVCPGRVWPLSDEEAARRIAAWLNEDASPAPIPSAVRRRRSPSMNYFYGDEGRREAVTVFLEKALERKTPPHLYLHSDEPFGWLYEDPAFARRWAELMAGYLQHGGRITMIHSVSRNLGEMLEGVEKWMPLYMMGSIEPWYCPRVRDGIYRRTRFLARDLCAVVSDSVEGMTADNLTIYTDDVGAVRAFSEEFSAFLALCRPLAEVYRPEDEKLLSPALQQFRAKDGELLTGQISGGARLEAKEGRDAFLFPPEGITGPVFHITEQQLVDSVWSYLRSGKAGPEIFF